MTSRTPRLLLGATVLAALLLAPTGAATAAPDARATGGTASAEAAGPAAVFLTHNVAGRLQNEGRTDPVAADLVRAVRSRTNVQGGVLQEICANQARVADRRLSGFRIHFFATGVRCASGAAFGNAVLLRNGPVVRNKVALPGDNSRIVGCATKKSPRLAVCSTHLVAARDDGAVRRQQGARVAQVAAGYVRRGFPTFVGGDFNDTPTADTLDPLYRRAYGGGARGVFTESNGCCGRSGTPTLGTAKFDYGFASAKWRVVRSWVGDASSSDHDRLWTVLRRR
ncbi:hypothetical protein GCM10009737_25730 [Nocardioides lentus]|uniref:Endonuclease/exonuclease/phosphatase domain-containing protein n=1 Tax=Nocardioides lentus TaxID=338077 RepID=A0ABP5AY89_9ACTN